MSASRDPGRSLEDLELPLDRDLFLRSLIGLFSGHLEERVGREETVAFVASVATAIGREIDTSYREALGVASLDREQVAEALVDLKRRVGGDFSILWSDERQIVLGNTACPFGETVAGRPGLCMMTRGVFREIAASNLGYARVELERTIAEGAPSCRVVVHLDPAEHPEEIE